jgi:glycine hydroxymethyltransferase
VPHCDFVTTTTHKTLRGPRAGLILSREKYAKAIDSAIFPGIQGGPLMHVIAGKAVAFGEALQPSFVDYSKQVIKNAQALAATLVKLGYKIISNGTDNHLMLADLRSKNVTGKDAQEALDAAGITVNKNAVPFDDKSPLITSGIRIGTPALTTRGMKEAEMEYIGGLINEVIVNVGKHEVHKSVAKKVEELCGRFPLYSELLT